jgi:serine/threonine-protein kinase
MTTKLLNNRYQVIQVLGAGGFGETFLAEDTHMPSRRRCVIKQLKPISNDPQTYQIIQQRFEREAATLEVLGESSDQIPKLYAYFSENGQFYLVQEWIHGQTLTKVIQSQGRLNENTVSAILLSLLSVLDYVHSKGIIHRDIKPDNIILRSQDNKPVLIDFGAVKETIRTVVNPSGYPTQSLVIGTPGYMPSEQAIGRPVYATDIYSLGLTAIYLLTGKYPQELDTDPHTGQILWQQYAAGVSPQLVKVLNQAIEPRTGDRFSTASKMLQILQSSSATAPPSIATTPTINFSPPTPTVAPTQPIASPSPRAVIKEPKYLETWQKPSVIIGSVLVGVFIGAMAISKIIPQPQRSASITTTPTITPESEPATSLPTNSPEVVEPIPSPIESTAPQTQVNTATLPQESTSSAASTPIASPEPITEPTPTPSVISTPEPQTSETPTIKETPNIQTNPPQKIRDRINQRVPAFPTGTSRSTVEEKLGTPKRDLRGLWGNTRAVTYKIVPNKIDVGYLFDRETGRLRQTEAAFAQSVNPQLMQNTLNGMLNGQATAEIQQGLQRVQQGEADNFTFRQGGVKGQIVRQECDFIYISVWESDLHDFVNPASAKQC